VEEQDRFCRRCGTPSEAPPAPVPRKGIKGRTVREFQHPGNVWEIAAAWAQQNGYALKGTDQYGQYYQRGTGFWSAPRRVQLQWTGSAYHLEAWVHVPTFNYILAWGILPREMILESGGFRGVVPRNMGRKEVNALLAMLGQPPIP